MKQAYRARSTIATPAFSRRRDRVRALIRKLRDRRLREHGSDASGRKSLQALRGRKRKIALALSAGAMALNTAAIDFAPPVSSEVHQMVQMSDGVMVDPSEHRVSADRLSVSDEMKEAMIEEEGVREVVYRDVAGYPTVGVGHLITAKDNLRVGDRVSYDRILSFLEQDLQTAERAAVRLLGDLPVMQHEFDALVDLIYNVGEGNVSEAKSPQLNRAIAAADYEAIADELHYHQAGGAKANGLVHRSERRANIFMDASYDDPREVRSEQAG